MAASMRVEPPAAAYVFLNPKERNDELIGDFYKCRSFAQGVDRPGTSKINALGEFAIKIACASRCLCTGEGRVGRKEVSECGCVCARAESLLLVDSWLYLSLSFYIVDVVLVETQICWWIL